MPIDRTESVGAKVHVGLNAKKRLNKLYRSRSNTDSEIHAMPRTYETNNALVALPEPLRNRLYEIFALIEREFEVTYSENIALHAKVEQLTAKLAESGTYPVEKISAETYENDSINVKALKKSSQVGQKLKTAFRVPPGRLVSSFKAGVGVGSDASRVHFVRPFNGHRDGVWDVHAMSHLSRPMVASASADQTGRIWCAETGNVLTKYVGHSGSVNSIRFHPLSNTSSDLFVVTASGDNSAHIWKSVPSWPTSASAPVVSPPNPPSQLYSSDEELEVPSEKEEDGDHINIVRSPLVQLTGHLGVVISADWLCGGNQIITASWDRTAKIYDAERGQILHVLSGHDQELTHTSTHSSQQLVVTSSKDTTFRLWDFREPIHSVSVFQGHTESVTSAVFTRTDKLVSGSDDRTVKVWDLKNMRSALATIRLDSPVNKLSVSASHHTIAIPHDNRHVRLFDLHGNRVTRLPRSNRRGHRRMVCATAWNDDSPHVNLLTCGFDKMILGWRISLV